MQSNMGEQVNKAYEVYRQASLEKDLAKKELEKMTEYYASYIRELQQKIEDQQQMIAKLQAQLSSTQPPGELRTKPRRRNLAVRPREEDRTDRTTDFWKTQHLKEDVEGVLAVPTPKRVIKPHLDNEGVLDVFGVIQEKFQQIQTLTRRQKEHLSRFHGGAHTANDQRFSMPIQCTDDTAERTEGPGASAPKASGAPPGPCPTRSYTGASCVSCPAGPCAGASSGASCGGAPSDVPQSSTALASRGASPEDRELDSLSRLSVRFPPAMDCEYDFLNSAPERAPCPPRCSPPPPLPDPAGPSYGLPPRPASVLPPPLTGEGGPLQPLWAPVRGVYEEGSRAGGPGVRDPQQGESSGPDKCEFCKVSFPAEHMKRHLFLHTSPAGEPRPGPHGGQED